MQAAPVIDLRRYSWILFGMLALMLFVNLAGSPIYILDEARNSQCAREMFLRHDFIVPTFNAELRTDKPPLHYFFMMLAYKAFGISAFSARFFSAVAGLLTVFITWSYTRKLINNLTAFAAAAVLTFSAHFIFEFRLAVPDPYLILFMTIGLFSVFTWLSEESAKQLFIAAGALGLATLAKGPVAIALPGLCVLVYISLRRKWKRLADWRLIPALALFLAVSLPWYLAVDKATDHAWTRGFFFEHNLNRFSSPQEGHGGFFLLPVLFVMIGLVPFIAFAGYSWKKGLIQFASRKLFQGSYEKAPNDLPLFAGIVVAVLIVFFCISSTMLPNYPMPCYPFAAVLLGGRLVTLLERQRPRRYPAVILLCFCVALTIGGWFAIRAEENTTLVAWLALLIILPAALLAPAVRAVSQLGQYLWIAAAFFALNVIGLAVIYPGLYIHNPVTMTIGSLKKKAGIVAYGIYNPAYNFYLDSPVHKYESIPELSKALRPGLIVISREEYEDSLRTLKLVKRAGVHDIFELPTTVIYEAAP